MSPLLRRRCCQSAREQLLYTTLSRQRCCDQRPENFVSRGRGKNFLTSLPKAGLAGMTSLERNESDIYDLNHLFCPTNPCQRIAGCPAERTIIRDSMMATSLDRSQGMESSCLSHRWTRSSANGVMKSHPTWVCICMRSLEFSTNIVSAIVSDQAA